MLTYNLDERNEDPLYVYLYKCIKKDIEDGIVHPHDRLPSKRTLARNLGVALITVESAYAQLMAEGYLYAEPRRGYFACDILSQPQPQNARRDFSDFATGKNTPSTAPEKDRKGRDPQEGNSSSQRDFTLYNLEKPELYNVKSRIRFNLASLETSPDSFPFSTWAKTLRDTLSLEPRSDLVSAQDCQGTKRLREAIAWHIRSVRGLEADPDCIVVGAGAQVLYNLIIQLLERPEAVALENPGYGRLASIYEANGIRIFPIPLDAKGISSEGLRACGADLAHITPSHQFPTGIVMPPSRRYELLAWATEKPGSTSSKTTTIASFASRENPFPLFRESTDPSASSTRTPSLKRSVRPSASPTWCFPRISRASIANAWDSIPVRFPPSIRWPLRASSSKAILTATSTERKRDAKQCATPLSKLSD